MGILKYIANVLHSNDNPVVTVGETVENGGIEGDSNPDGSNVGYVKFPDGTMIQWGSIYGLNFIQDEKNTYMYPYPFVGKSNVVLTSTGGRQVSNDWQGLYDRFVFVMNDTGEAYVSFQAIGRWK